MTANCQIGFQSQFPKNTKRTWIGPEYWANRLQDWQIKDGRLECLETREREESHKLIIDFSKEQILQ